jgi:ribosomal protein S14
VSRTLDEILDKHREKLAREYAAIQAKEDVPEETIDVSRFKPLTSDDLASILGLTIKKDKINKLLVFLAQLSAYTEENQLNISFNAPSSTGKSYIPLEISQLFPAEDVIAVGYCSPTAFFHDVGVFDKEKAGYIVDLSRKILIFLDQPHTLLLQHLRPFLSHDKKEIRLKITDKSQKAGLRTKNIYLKGYPAVIFCTAGLKIDEQEATRFLLLSPETNQEKIREAIYQRIKKETDRRSYESWLESNPERCLLKERILAIKQERIRDIKIGSPEEVEKRFFSINKVLKPRHQRDISRILSLIKCFALLNLWFRERDGETLVANSQDIEEAFAIWEEIAEAQELNLPPYIYHFYQDIVLPAWEEKGVGLSRKDIAKRHFELYGRVLPDWQLRKEIIPMLEVAGLIMQEPDPSDKRKILVYPTMHSTISPTEKYSGHDGGVEESELDEANESDEENSEQSVTDKASSQDFMCRRCGRKAGTLEMPLFGDGLCRDCFETNENFDDLEDFKEVPF